MQLTDLRRVEAPDDSWAQVISSAVAADRLTFDDHRRVEHPYIQQWWGRHEQHLTGPGWTSEY